MLFPRERVEEVTLDRIVLEILCLRAAEAQRRVAMTVAAQDLKGGSRDALRIFRVGAGGLPIGGERRFDVARDHGFDEPRQSESLNEFLVRDARRDLFGQGAAGAGEIAGEEQRLSKPRVDESILAADRDRRAPITHGLGVAPLLETQEAEAEGGFGELGIVRQSRSEGRFGAKFVRKLVGDQRKAQPGARQGRVEGERPIEDRPRFGRIARRMQRGAEVQPQRRVIGRDGRRGREHNAGGSRIARGPMGQTEPPERVGRGRLLQEQRVERFVGCPPSRDPRCDLGGVEAGDDRRQIGFWGVRERREMLDSRLLNAQALPGLEQGAGLVGDGPLARRA